MPTTAAGVSPGQAGVQLSRQDRAIHEFDEVATVFGKVGRAESATDPAPFSMAETTIRLRPRSEWPKQQQTRWYSSWAPAPAQAAARPGVARSEDTDDRRAGREARSRGRAAGMDERLDRAGASAHGHDVDRGSHARRHPHRGRGSGTPGCARRRGAQAGGPAPRYPERGLRIAGRRALADLRARPRRLGAAPACRRGSLR